jgi:4-diphosphocytidyl-2-C-methyl-D-erythritol kinase
VATRAAIRPRQGRYSADRGQARARAGAARQQYGARRLNAAAITAFAPAKVNLYLHITGRRADGYHLIDSLVAFADIGDAVTAAPAETLSLTVSGPEAGALAGLGEDNLVLRAARALAAHRQASSGAALALDKHLPVASGIGGGSGDAAAALRALATLWRRPLDAAGAIAISLGADVPVCLGGSPAWVGGIGEAVEPLPALPPLGIVLANPRRELPTAAVFRARQGAFTAGERPRVVLPDAAALIALLGECRNDLTDAALGVMPEIATLLDRLAALPQASIARMSGSGATSFALFPDRAAAQHAAAMLATAEPGWWVRAGSLLSGPPPISRRPP